VLRRHRNGDDCAVTRQTPVTLLLYRTGSNFRNKTDSQRDVMRTAKKVLRRNNGGYSRGLLPVLDFGVERRDV
jgi:hypothetical protein